MKLPGAAVKSQVFLVLIIIFLCVGIAGAVGLPGGDAYVGFTLAILAALFWVMNNFMNRNR